MRTLDYVSPAWLAHLQTRNAAPRNIPGLRKAARSQGRAFRQGLLREGQAPASSVCRTDPRQRLRTRTRRTSRLFPRQVRGQVTNGISNTDNLWVSLRGACFLSPSLRTLWDKEKQRGKIDGVAVLDTHTPHTSCLPRVSLVGVNSPESSKTR